MSHSDFDVVTGPSMPQLRIPASADGATEPLAGTVRQTPRTLTHARSRAQEVEVSGPLPDRVQSPGV